MTRNQRLLVTSNVGKYIQVTPKQNFRPPTKVLHLRMQYLKGWGATSGPDNKYVLLHVFFNQIPPPDSYRAIGVKIPFEKKNLKNTQRHTDTPPFD